MKWEMLLCEKRKRGHNSEHTGTDPRDEFQKDYHRIIGSASFRRLQDKTQVFPLDTSDFVRTRLTHSLETSSLAKSLGEMIFKYIIIKGRDTEVTEEVKSKICSVLECAGLIHDIGNPPFGHFGEDLIRDWFIKNLPQKEYDGIKITERLTEQMQNDFYHFEGNAHALRLLTKLHFLVDENGMNLTYTLLNTIIKYPVPSTGINKKSGNIKDKKMGYFYAEKDIFDEITAATGAVDCRHPLAFILEAADDIAYKTGDIEDAVKKGFISYQKLLGELRGDSYRGRCADSGEYEEYDRAVKKLETCYGDDIKNGVSSPEKNAVQRWVIHVQGVLLKCAAFGFTRYYKEIMDGSFSKELLAVSHGNALAYALSDIAYRYVFTSEAIYRPEVSAAMIFEFLLDKFVSAAINYGDKTKMSPLDSRMTAFISENYKKAYERFSEGKDENEKLYLRLLLVTDTICGMTDSYARRLYRELNGIE
ncbi:MAG: deoxyguanosinetriphosphate triphosphohydrolase [Eubacterium sp.]|nr:deoxyguanosinetriphosphate triphosphohydrolase [Eubacterium sp.]